MILPEVDVSVIIIVRNGAKTIRRQLDALGQQVDAPPFEVIVSNNGSTDATQSVVEEWAQHNLGTVAVVRIIDSGQRPGIPYARNAGAVAARGRLLAFCDADDAVHRGWVAAHAKAVTVGMGGGRVHPVRPNGTPDPATIPPGLQGTVYLPHASGCNFAVTRRAFFEVGGFDESLPPYGCDDVEFSWRIQEAGYPLTYVPDAAVDFTITPRTRVVRKEFLMAKARMAVFARHPKSSGIVPTFAGSIRDLAVQGLLLPYRMLRPGEVPRTRWVRWVVDAAGRLVGYWQYVGKASHRPPLLVDADGTHPTASHPGFDQAVGLLARRPPSNETT